MEACAGDNGRLFMIKSDQDRLDVVAVVGESCILGGH